MIKKHKETGGPIDTGHACFVSSLKGKLEFNDCTLRQQ